jgi:predicted metal-dependent peptidase
MTSRTAGKYYYRSTTAFSTVGNYSYSIRALDTSNNPATSSTVLFSMPPNWDVNRDGAVTILDLVLISNYYSQSGSDGWIREDVDNNGDVEVLDMSVVSSHFGEEWWV